MTVSDDGRLGDETYTLWLEERLADADYRIQFLVNFMGSLGILTHDEGFTFPDGDYWASEKFK